LEKIRKGFSGVLEESVSGYLRGEWAGCLSKIVCSFLRCGYVDIDAGAHLEAGRRGQARDDLQVPMEIIALIWCAREIEKGQVIGGITEAGVKTSEDLTEDLSELADLDAVHVGEALLMPARYDPGFEG